MSFSKFWLVFSMVEICCKRIGSRVDKSEIVVMLFNKLNNYLIRVFVRILSDVEVLWE